MLTELLIDLETHNEEQSAGSRMGKTLGRFIMSAIDDEKPDMQKTQADVTIETAQEARVGLAELNTKHQKILERFGLILSHQAGEGLKHGLPSGPISMRIENVHSFLRYTQSVPAAPDSTNGGLEAFKTLLKAVEEQIASINFQHPSPEEKSLLENIEMLRDSFKRLAPALDLTRLQHFVDFKDRLESYLTIERAELWTRPGEGFGPADWVRDITPERLEENWAAALKTLQAQEALGDTGAAPELREHLMMCINRASDQLLSLSWREETKKKLQEILEKYKEALKN